LVDHGLLLSRRSFGGVFYALPNQETELARLVEESNTQGAAHLQRARDDAREPAHDDHLEAVLRGMLKAGKMPAKLTHIHEWSGLNVTTDGLVELLNELLNEGLVRQAKGERWALTSKGLSLAQEG
jgi:predicted transcriptional regulator